LTVAGSGCGGLPTEAFAISQGTVGKFLDSANLANFDSSLLHLTRAVILFLTALYFEPQPKKSLCAISTRVSGQRYRGSVPSLTVILFRRVAWSMLWTIPLLINLRTASGSLIRYTSDQGQVSSALRRAGGESFLKFLCLMDFLEGDNLSIDTDASGGKWSVVVLVSTLMVATRSLDTHMWSRMDSYSFASPSSFTACRGTYM
jgi:hypothetical protein